MVVAQTCKPQLHGVEVGWLPAGDPLRMETPSRFVAEVDRQLPHAVIDDGAEPRHDNLVVPGLILVVSADHSATVGASVAQATRASLSAVAVRDPAK